MQGLDDDTVGRRAAGRRTAVIAAGVSVVAIALGSTWLWTRELTLQCKGAERALVGTWDPARADAVRTAFAATGKPYAADTATRVVALLDAWAREWARTTEEACEATRLRAAQPERLLELRMACLDRRRQEVRGLGALLVKPTAQTVEKAVGAARELTPISTCSDLETLLASVPLPEEPQARAAIGETQQQLADAKALWDTGQSLPALERTRAVWERAKQTGWRPLEAEALYWLGRAQERTGDFEAAASSLRRAELAADASRLDALLASARVALVYVVGSELNRPEQGLELAEHARAALERAGTPAQTEGALERALGALRWQQGRFDEALTHFQRMHELTQKSGAADSPSLAMVENDLGGALQGLGRFDEAKTWHGRALAMRRKTLGEEHPDVGESTLALERDARP